jgi:hypothetical protein
LAGQRLKPLPDRGAGPLWRFRVMAEAEHVAARIEQGLDLERELPRESVAGLPRSARAAGLEVVAASGYFVTGDPELGFGLNSGALAAAREPAIKLGIAAERIDDLLLDLRAAQDRDYEWVSSPFFLDLALRKMGAGQLSA